jgi:hypothetical protein
MLLDCPAILHNMQVGEFVGCAPEQAIFDCSKDGRV